MSELGKNSLTQDSTGTFSVVYCFVEAWGGVGQGLV